MFDCLIRKHADRLSDYNFGSCRQTIEGGNPLQLFLSGLVLILLKGNHFRYWIQSGPEASSGALFLAYAHLHSSDTSSQVW